MPTGRRSAGDPESKAWAPGQLGLEVFRDVCASVEGRVAGGILVTELWFAEGKDRGKRVKCTHHQNVRTAQPLGIDELCPYVMALPPSLVKQSFGAHGAWVWLVSDWQAEEKLPTLAKMSSESTVLMILERHINRQLVLYLWFADGILGPALRVLSRVARKGELLGAEGSQGRMQTVSSGGLVSTPQDPELSCGSHGGALGRQS